MNNISVSPANSLRDAQGAEALSLRGRAGRNRLSPFQSQGVCQEVHGQVWPCLPEACRRGRLAFTEGRRAPRSM